MIETVIFQTSTTITEACNNLFRFLIELHDWSQKAQEIRTELAVIMEYFLYEMLQGIHKFLAIITFQKTELELSTAPQKLLCEIQ